MIHARASSPLSGNHSTSKLRDLDSEKIKADWNEQFGINIDGEWIEEGTVEEHFCEETGLIFFTPDSAAGKPRLYECLQNHDWYYLEDKWEFNEAIKSLEKSDVVLEIGSGSGSFLKKAILKGLSVFGCETNLRAAADLRALGFKVFESRLEDIVKDPDQRLFDVICAFQVLEHVPNPGSFIRHCLANLSPKGRLIFSVPNNQVLGKLDPVGQDLLNHPPHHMSKWTAEVFESLERFFPLAIEKISFDSLEANQVKPYIRRKLQARLERWPIGLSGNFITRLSRLLAKALILFRLNRLIRGYTLLVVLRKL